MNIGVSARGLLKNSSDGAGLFAHEVLSRLTATHREHQFYYFFDEPYSRSLPSHITPVTLLPAATNALLWKYWFDIKIPAALKKYKIDLFVSFDGWCSLHTSIPQLLFVTEGSPDYTSSTKNSLQQMAARLYRRRFLKKASLLFVMTEEIESLLVNQYHVSSQKIKQVYTGLAPIFQPCTLEIKSSVKQQITDGKEFFLVRGTFSSAVAISVLKAFSLFKKRQQSNWKLLLPLQMTTANKTLQQLLPSYKYRNDVVFTGEVSQIEEARILGSAYAAFCFSKKGKLSVLEAFRCGTPCLVPADESLSTVIQPALIQFNAGDTADIAEKMMHLYKDESARTILSEKAANIASLYNWERTSKLVWEGIEEIF